MQWHCPALVVPNDGVLDLAAVLAGGRLVLAGGAGLLPARRFVGGHGGPFDGAAAGAHRFLFVQRVHVERPRADLGFLDDGSS